MRRKDRAFARGVERGLKKGGLLIQRGAQLKVPVDTGALKAGAFTRAEGSGFATKVRVGFEAAYAVFVHEHPAPNLGKNVPRTHVRYPGHVPKGNVWDPAGRGQPHYLSNSISENKDQAGKIVRAEAYKAKFQ